MAVEMWDGSDFVSSRIKKLQNSASDLITQTPIIPIWSYDEKGHPQAISIKSLGDLWNKWIQAKKQEYTKRSADEMDEVMRMRWIISDDMLTEKQKTWIRQAWWVSTTWMRELQAMKSYIKDKKNKITWKWLKLNPKAPDPFWRQEFEGWLERASNANDFGNNSVLREMVRWWNDPANRATRTLEELFRKVGWSAKAYAEFFWLWENITTWDQLKDLDISGESE